MRKTLLDIRYAEFVSAVVTAVSAKQTTVKVFNKTFAVAPAGSGLESLMTYKVDGIELSLGDKLADKAACAIAGCLGDDLITKGHVAQRLIAGRGARNEKRQNAFQNLTKLYGEDLAKKLWQVKVPEAHDAVFADVLKKVLKALNGDEAALMQLVINEKNGMEALAIKVAGNLHSKRKEARNGYHHPDSRCRFRDNRAADGLCSPDKTEQNRQQN